MEEGLWFCRVFDTELGPLPFPLLCEMVKTGQLGRDDYVRSAAGTSAWQRACEVAPLQLLISAREAESTQVFKPSSEGRSDTFTEIVDPPWQGAREEFRETTATPSDTKIPGQATSSSRNRQTETAQHDKWYYRLEGREHGPITLAALQELIGSNGETAELVSARHSSDDKWTAFFDVPANTGLATRRVAETRSPRVPSERGTSRTKTSSNRGIANPRSLRETAKQNRYILIGVAIWGLVNVGILVAWSDPYSTERKYFGAMPGSKIESVNSGLRDASEQEWAALHSDLRKTLTPIVADLKRTAAASNPVRQHLLWVARDQLPKLASPDGGGKQDVHRAYQNHMQFIERQISP